jgi:hypothetical protein
MKVNYAKEFKNYKGYYTNKGNAGSKTKKVVGLFMAAIVAVSAGCYLTTPRQADQEDKDDQNSHSGSSGSGYRSTSSSKNGQISEGITSGKAGIGSSAVGGAE